MLTKNNKTAGFTLVEVIVVAVIVAALAVAGIPLYIGYINNSSQQTASSLAQSAAEFLASVRNANQAALPNPAVYSEGLIWDCPTNMGGNVTFIIPPGSSITTTGNALTATIRGQTSASYPY